jgi:hypothetical protein
MHTEWDELFTTTDFKKATFVPDSPLESLEFQLTPASTASATLGERLLRAAFIEQLAPTDQLSKVAPSAVKPISDDRSSLVESLQKKGPEHKYKIAGMLGEFRAALGGRGTAEAWDRLEKSSLECMYTQILEEVR